MKFSVFELSGTAGKYSLKKLQTATVKGNATVETKPLLLKQGTYYVGVESTTAKKGGSASYEIGLSDKSTFYQAADNTDDSWQKAAAQQTALEMDDVITGWVGFGDKADFRKIELDESGKLVLELDDDTAAAIKSRQLKLSCVDACGKNVALEQLNPESFASKKDLYRGTYYVGVLCANEKKYNTSYEIQLGTL